MLAKCLLYNNSQLQSTILDNLNCLYHSIKIDMQCLCNLICIQISLQQFSHLADDSTCHNMTPCTTITPVSTVALTLNLRVYVTFIVDLFRTYRPPSLTSTRDGYHLGTCPVSNHLRQSHSSDWPGVEPVPFYCFGPSKKPRQRDCTCWHSQNLVQHVGFEPTQEDPS